MGKIEAIKRFFSTPEKPVANTELLEFRRADPKGFDEVADACIKALEG